MFSFKDWLRLNEGIQDEPYALHAVFMAGTPAAGKTTVAQSMFGGLGFKFADPDQIYEAISKRSQFDPSAEGDPTHPDFSAAFKARAWSGFLNAKRADVWQSIGLPYVIDITSGNKSLVTNLKSELEKAGYDTFMVMVMTDLPETFGRNKRRKRQAGSDYTYQIYDKLVGGESGASLVWEYITFFGGTISKADAEESECGIRKYGNMLIVDNNKSVPLPTKDTNSSEYRTKQACWLKWATKLIGPPNTVKNPIGRQMLAKGTDYAAQRQPAPLTEPRGTSGALQPGGI